MKAIILTTQGGVENLKLSDVPIPEIKQDEVLIAVKSISINPVEVIVRENIAVDWVFNGEAVKIIGWDISGVVTAVGTAVTSFKPGDEVFGCVNHPGHGKAYAEYVAAPAAHLALKPANITHDEAAAATLAALTVLQPMQKVGVGNGDRVFITAAGGGVGHFAIQFAKYFGAYVIALASGQKREFVLSLGADMFIDYTTQRFEELVKDADLAIDAVKADHHILRTLNTVKQGGNLISLWSQLTPDETAKAEQLGVHAFYNSIRSNGEDMQFIAELLSRGHIRPYISKTFAFEEMHLAHTAIESNHTTGKIIIRVN